MQHDEVIWGVINHGFCSFKTRVRGADVQTFCRNEHNVTGLCNRQSCPLANSRYATVREEEGKLYLMVKTIERAHSPKNLWEKIPLDANYTKALAQIDTELEWFPKYQVHKNKQRLTKITQYLIRMKRLEKAGGPKIVTVHKKVERREKKREAKAQVAAQLEKSIEKELLARLRGGTYGDIYNFPMTSYEKTLDAEAEMDEAAEELEEEEEREFVEGDYGSSEEDLEDLGDRFAGGGDSSYSEEGGSEDSEASSSGGEEASDDDEDDDEDVEPKAKRRSTAEAAKGVLKRTGKVVKRPPSGRRVSFNKEVEYEQETEPAMATRRSR